MAPPLRRQSSVDTMVENLGLKGFGDHELAAVKEALFRIGLTTTDILTEKEALEELTKDNLKGALVAAGIAEERSAMLAIQVRQKICSSAAKRKKTAWAVGRGGELAATAAAFSVAFILMGAGPPVSLAGLVLFVGWCAYKRSASLSVMRHPWGLESAGGHPGLGVVGSETM